MKTGSTLAALTASGPLAATLARAIALAIATTAAASPLAAQGLSVYTHSSCMIGRASAGVADPCADGSAIFYGPAAVALQPGALNLGIVPIYTKSTFTFDTTGAHFGSIQGTTWVPNAWITYRPLARLGVGVGVWAPYGLETRWPLNFEGRYLGYNNKLTTVYIQPTIALQAIPHRLALGVGLDIVRGSVKIQQRRDLATTFIPGTTTPFAALGVPLGTDFADLALSLSDWSTTFHLGMEAILTERLPFGARYLHTTNLHLDNGHARFQQVETRLLLPAGNPFGLSAGTPIDVVLAPLFELGGPLSEQEVSTAVTFPNQFVVGFRYRVIEPLRLFFDYQWTGWRHLDEADLEFQFAPADTLFLQFRSTSTFRLGADYASPHLWAVRAGVIYNNAAEPPASVSPLLPEARRWSFTTGVGYHFTERFRGDGGIEYVSQADRRGHLRPRSRTASAAEINRGIYRAHAVAAGISFSYLIGGGR